MSASSCDRVRGHLSGYLDARLAPGPARAVSLHLAACEACQAERDALLALSRAALELPLVAPAPGLADRVRHARGRVAWPVRVAAGLIVVGCVAGGYALGRWHAAPSPPPADVTRADAGPTDAAPIVKLADGDDPRRVPKEGIAEVSSVEGGRVDGGSATVPLAPATEPPLPADATAVRAARSLAADLELLDSVPIGLHEPILRPQVERYDLATWAERRADDPELHAVADLIRRLDRSLAGGLEPLELADLRGVAARRKSWPAGSAMLVANEPAPRDLGALLDRHGRDLSPTTRRSLDAWVSFKDEWIRGDGDMAVLSGMIDDIAPALPRGEASAFAFPDLGDLFDRIEWTEDGAGGRNGRLEVEQRSENGISILRIEVHSNSSGGGSH